jgi:hypothetical protein
MKPRLTSAIVAMVGALALAGVATAHDDHHATKGAKVYRATFKTGKAQLVDAKKRNKISIHVRGLKAGETYAWQIHRAANATDDPCEPTTPVIVPAAYGDWTYGALVANAAGNASAKGTSATFDSRADVGPFYVDVHQADGAVVACGVLKAKPKKPHGKKSHATKRPQARHDDAKGKGPGDGDEPGHGHDD